MVRNFIDSNTCVRHVTVGTRHTSLPMNTVIGEEFELRMTDESHLESSNILLPLLIRLVATYFLDDILNCYVPPLPTLTREEDVNGVHLLVFLYDIGDVRLGTHNPPHILPCQFLRIGS